MIKRHYGMRKNIHYCDNCTSSFILCRDENIKCIEPSLHLKKMGVLFFRLDIDNMDFDLIEANLELKNLFLELFVPEVIWKKEKEDFIREYKFNLNSKGVIKVKLGDKYGFVLSQLKSVLLEELINLK